MMVESNPSGIVSSRTRTSTTPAKAPQAEAFAAPLTQGGFSWARLRNDGDIQPVFSWRLRIYWEDTDAGGVVYHAGYLRFLERARTEWLRALGSGQTQLRERHGVMFVVREMTIAFDRPARLDDELDATVMLEQKRSASLQLAQTVVRAGEDAPLIRARVRVACVDAANWAPCRIPEEIACLIDEE